MLGFDLRESNPPLDETSSESSQTRPMWARLSSPLKRPLSEYVRYHHEDRMPLRHWGRELRSVETHPEAQVASYSRSGSARCIIVTIGLPDTNQPFHLS